jgi:hypothetical protein
MSHVKHGHPPRSRLMIFMCIEVDDEDTIRCLAGDDAEIGSPQMLSLSAVPIIENVVRDKIVFIFAPA